MVNFVFDVQFPRVHHCLQTRSSLTIILSSTQSLKTHTHTHTHPCCQLYTHTLSDNKSAFKVKFMKYWLSSVYSDLAKPCGTSPSPFNTLLCFAFLSLSVFFPSISCLIIARTRSLFLTFTLNVFGIV